MNPGVRWGIVGGGVLGMTLALRLRQAGHNVTLLEAAESLGGLAAPWQLQTGAQASPIQWDKHYHVTLLSDLHLRRLLGELGLEKDMRWVETRTGFYDGKALYPLSSSLDYLKLPSLSLLEKARLAATILYASKVKNWRKLEAVSAVDWLTKLSGRAVVEKLWIPLLKAKLGENFRVASAAFIWAVISRLYAARRTGLKKEMFGYLPGGYGRMLAVFEAELRELGVNIFTGCAVEQVRTAADGSTMLAAGGSTMLTTSGPAMLATKKRQVFSFDHVVFTTPAPVVAAACPELSTAEKNQLGAVRYQGIICASLLLRRPLADNYLTYITDRTIPFTAVVEMTTLVDRTELGGNTLVYLPMYVDPSDPALQASDDDIRRSFLPALARMYPNFSENDVLSFQVSRVSRVFALPTLHYSEISPWMHTSMSGVHIVNSAQIVNGTLNVNETVQLAERAARELRALAPARAEELRKFA